MQLWAGSSYSFSSILLLYCAPAGLPAPTMRMEILLGSDPTFTRWISDLLCSLRPLIERLNFSLNTLSDFDTLPERLQAEVAASKTAVPFVALVGAWSHLPIDQASLQQAGTIAAGLFG
jgi:hypothetical protein